MNYQNFCENTYDPLTIHMYAAAQLVENHWYTSIIFSFCFVFIDHFLLINFTCLYHILTDAFPGLIFTSIPVIRRFFYNTLILFGYFPRFYCLYQYRSVALITNILTVFVTFYSLSFCFSIKWRNRSAL